MHHSHRHTPPSQRERCDPKPEIVSKVREHSSQTYLPKWKSGGIRPSTCACTCVVGKDPPRACACAGPCGLLRGACTRPPLCGPVGRPWNARWCEAGISVMRGALWPLATHVLALLVGGGRPAGTATEAARAGGAKRLGTVGARALVRVGVGGLRLGLWPCARARRPGTVAWRGRWRGVARRGEAWRVQGRVVSSYLAFLIWRYLLTYYGYACYGTPCPRSPRNSPRTTRTATRRHHSASGAIPSRRSCRRYGCSCRTRTFPFRPWAAGPSGPTSSAASTMCTAWRGRRARCSCSRTPACCSGTTCTATCL